MTLRIPPCGLFFRRPKAEVHIEPKPPATVILSGAKDPSVEASYPSEVVDPSLRSG